MPGKGLPLTNVHKAPARATFPQLSFVSRIFTLSSWFYELHYCL